MKKILFWAAVTILAAVSCNKIEEGGAITFEPSNVPTFVASVDGADTETKTIIKENMSYWNGTEEIRVFDGKKNKVYTATVEEAETATFNEKEGTVFTGTTYFAAYPATPAGSVTWDGKVENAAKKFWLPESQTATLGSYDPATHIAVAYTTSNNLNLEFKNVTSLVKVEIPYDNITEVYFYGNSGEIIAGNFDVKYNEGNPTVVRNDNDSYTKYTDVKIAKQFKQGEVYYLSILPTTFKSGFTIEFVMDGVKYIKKLNKEYTVNRNEVINLPKIEFEKFATEEGKLYLAPNSDWRQANARFAAYFFVDDNTNTWVNMERVPNTYYYSCDIPAGYKDANICRMNPASEVNDWNNKWNQTSNLNLLDGNLCTITGWDSGVLSGAPAVVDGPGMPSDWAVYYATKKKEYRMIKTETDNIFVVKGLVIGAANDQVYVQKYNNTSTKYGGGVVYLESNKKMKLTSSSPTNIRITTAGTYDMYFDNGNSTKYLYVVPQNADYKNAVLQEYSNGYLFLKPNSNWTQSSARFAAYFMDSNKSKTTWVSMTQSIVDSNIYEVAIPSGTWKYVIFCRMNPKYTDNRWNTGSDTEATKRQWNQTDDLEIPTGKTLFAVKDGTWDKGGGTWSAK